MANVQTVNIYDQPTGVGATRLRCVATLVTDPEAGQVPTISLTYVIVLVIGPPVQQVEIAREDWLAIRAFRAMP